MIIISHRGYWKYKYQQNKINSLLKSLNNNHGVELDIRDHNSKIVISHDFPNNKSLLLKYLFEKIFYLKNNFFVALNIKSDGLQNELKKIINEYEINKYFVFDMSIPDGIQYMKKKIHYFIRTSEYEKDLIFYNKAKGVWLDQFKKNWINEKVILYHFNNKKKICIVSPELHSREYKKEWIKYKKIEKKFLNLQLMLCTDFPNIAESFFND